MQQEIQVSPPAGVVLAPQEPGSDDGLDGGAESVFAMLPDQPGGVFAADVGKLPGLRQADLHRSPVPHFQHLLRPESGFGQRRLARGDIIRVGMGMGVRIIFIGGKGKGRGHFRTSTGIPILMRNFRTFHLVSGRISGGIPLGRFPPFPLAVPSTAPLNAVGCVSFSLAASSRSLHVSNGLHQCAASDAGSNEVFDGRSDHAHGTPP